VTLVDQKGHSPVPPGGPAFGWPPQGIELEAHAVHRAGDSMLVKRAAALFRTFFYYLILRLRLPVGGFVPTRYLQQVVENSDFRKFDDALRMVIDCTPEVADEIERMLADAEREGIVRYGLHRQQAAMMTCFTPFPMRPDHIHFVDGASGGYALAARALKTRMQSAA
jgi:hypothetical protein